MGSWSQSLRSVFPSPSLPGICFPVEGAGSSIAFPFLFTFLMMAIIPAVGNLLEIGDPPSPLVPSKLFINGQVAPNASKSVVLGSNATEVVAVL